MSVIADGRAVISRQTDQQVTRSATTRMQFVAKGSQVDRDFGLFEYELAGESAGASPHYHRTFSETFYVLDGELDVLDGDTWVAAGAGDLVYVPRSSVHGFRNSGVEPVRFMLLFTPGSVPREDYFEAVRARKDAGLALSTDERDAFARQFDQYNVH